MSPTRPMAVRLAADLHPSADGSAVRTSLVAGQLQAASVPIAQPVKGSPHSITERMVPELIPVLCSQSAGDVSHKPGGRLPLLSARPAVTLTTLNRAATNFAAW